LNNKQYRCIVTGDCTPYVTSSAATLTVNTSPVVTDPVATIACAGSSTTFSVIATGSGTLSYQWQENGINISDVSDFSNFRI